jgi:hypothetical protein
MNAIARIKLNSANDPDPSGDDILAAMGGLGRNERCYIELGRGKGAIAVYYEPDWDQDDEDATGKINGAWVVHHDGLHNRKPFPTLMEAMVVALKQAGALL